MNRELFNKLNKNTATANIIIEFVSENDSNSNIIESAFNSICNDYTAKLVECGVEKVSKSVYPTYVEDKTYRVAYKFDYTSIADMHEFCDAICRNINEDEDCNVLGVEFECNDR